MERTATEGRPVTSSPAAPPPRRFAHVVALDGLRGLAVTLVVLYHFTPSLVPGGFLGVDVFFVLSGFLITSLALGEHAGTGQVSAPAFFGRRARRLLPAAVTTVVVTVAIAVALDPAAWRGSLRGEAVASLLYVNNWWAIAQDSSYQVVFGAESPLNHFWSLSIEEQFYAVFPVVLLGLVAVVRRQRRGTETLARLLLVVSAAGALASALEMALLYDPLRDPSRLYFGTDTRLQAVLVGVAGGCATWLWGDRVRRRLSGLGLTVIAVAGTAIVLVASARGGFRQSWLYQGGFLLVALAAVAVVLAVVVHRGSAARVFEVGPLVTLGLFSYGIYLWHWPVKVFLDPERTGLDGLALFAARVAVTALATWLSYRLVERPFRSPRTGTETPRVARALRAPRGGWIAVGAVAASLVVVWVVARPELTTHANSVEQAPERPAQASPTAPAAPLRVMWTGDSVAWTMGGGQISFPKPSTYDTVFEPDSLTLWNLGEFSCQMLAVTFRTLDGVQQPESTCTGRAERWADQIATFEPEVVAWYGAVYDTNDVHVDGRWVEFGTPEWDELYRASLDEARIAATASGAVLVLLGQSDPIAKPAEPHLEALRPDDLWRFGHLRELQRGFAAAHPDDTRYVDLQALLCPSGGCPETSPDGITYRPDGIHWSIEGARLVAPVVTAAIYDAVDRTPPT